MAKLLNQYPDKLYLGKVNRKRIYLKRPSWDCDWYWGFGYLGNSRLHYHVDSLKDKVNYFEDKKGVVRREVIFNCLFDGFKEHFDKGTFIVKDDKDIWLLCELFETFYKLKETASILGRGHCNVSNESPLVDVIIDVDYANKINNEILPQVFDKIYDILLKYSKTWYIGTY